MEVGCPSCLEGLDPVTPSPVCSKWRFALVFKDKNNSISNLSCPTPTQYIKRKRMFLNLRFESLQISH